MTKNSAPRNGVKTSRRLNEMSEEREKKIEELIKRVERMETIVELIRRQLNPSKR